MKEIPLYPGYFADTNGCIYSKLKGNLKVRKLRINPDGRYDVNLYRRKERGRGRSFKRTVHQLILETFVGPKPKGGVGRHLNDNPLDNRLVNLAWGTRKENSDDFYKRNVILKSDFYRFIEKKYPEIIREYKSMCDE